MEKEEKWSYTSNIKTQTEESEIYALCSFSSLGLNSTLSDLLRKKFGFEAPTPVQAEAIPVILSGRHVIVNAETGLGKTIAYLAPIIHQLQGLNTRIERSHGTFGINILIATPGRLLDHLKNTSFVYTNLRWIVFDEADRILELGFGKDIEEIPDLLGSGAGKSVGIGNPSEPQRQNLLLSATLNEQVNHLAKISLENPVMIGLDNMKMQPGSSVYQSGSLGSNLYENLDHSNKLVNSSTGGDGCGTLGELMCGFNARREAGKRPAGESSPSPSPAKKIKAGGSKGEPVFGAGDDKEIATTTATKGIKISLGHSTKSSVAVPAPLPKSGKDGGAEESIGYDWVVKHWPISEVEAFRKTNSIDMLKSGVGLLAQVMSANFAAIVSMEEELLRAGETKKEMEVVRKEKEELQTKLVAEQELRIAYGKAKHIDITYKWLDCQLKETMALDRERTKRMILEMEALQVELERERKEKEEFRAKLHKEQLWRNELLEQLHKQVTGYRESALFEVQLKYGPLNLTEIPFENLRPAPPGFNVFNPTAEALEQQRNKRVNEDDAVGKNVDVAAPDDPGTSVDD